MPSPRALRGETGVRGVREACPPGAAIPRVRSLAGRWAEGGGARPRGSAGMRGREGGARPRNGQARQPMGSRSFEIRPIAARGRAYLPVGGAGAHPGAADSGLEEGSSEGRRAGVQSRLQGECGPGRTGSRGLSAGGGPLGSCRMRAGRGVVGVLEGRRPRADLSRSFGVSFFPWEASLLPRSLELADPTAPCSPGCPPTPDFGGRCEGRSGHTQPWAWTVQVAELRPWKRPTYRESWDNGNGSRPTGRQEVQEASGPGLGSG